MSTNPEKSAADRARAFLDRLPRWPWNLEYRSVVDADDETILDDVGLRDSAEDLQEFIAASPALVEQLLQDLADATELRDVAVRSLEKRTNELLAAEDALRAAMEQVTRSDGDKQTALNLARGFEAERDEAREAMRNAVQLLHKAEAENGALDVKRLQAEERAERAEREREEIRAELTTSRAALDKTRIEADAQLSWIGLARPVVEAVRRAQNHDEADPTDPWSPLYRMSLPPEKT